MRTIMTLAGALLALALHAVAARGQCTHAPAARSYQIDCKLLEVAEDGSRHCKASPTLIALDGQQAQILMGGEQAVTGLKEGSVEFVPFGFSLRTKLSHGHDGHVRADVAWERTRVEEGRTDALKIQATSCRTIRTVKLGETIKLVEKAEAGQRRTLVEMVIREVPSSQLTGVGVNSDAGLTGTIALGPCRLLTGNVAPCECHVVAPPVPSAALCLPPCGLESCPERQPAPLPPPAPALLEAAPLPALAPGCLAPDPLLGLSAAMAGFVPPPAAGFTPPCVCPAPCCPTPVPPAPESAAMSTSGNCPSVDDIMEHVRQLRKDRVMLLAQKEMLENEEKAALALVHKRLDAQCRDLKDLSSDGWRETTPSSSTKSMSATAAWKKMDQKLDGILDRLNQLEERFNDSDKPKADSQKSSSRRVRPSARFYAVVPFLGPLPIAIDFGFPLGQDAKKRDQNYSFWIGYFR